MDQFEEENKNSSINQMQNKPSNGRQNTGVYSNDLGESGYGYISNKNP